MSQEGMSKTVLATGLEKVAYKFIGVDNGLPPGSAESDYYILEGAMQYGFEMIDDDGDVFICSSRQIVELCKPYKDEAERLRALLATVERRLTDIQRALTPRED